MKAKKDKEKEKVRIGIGGESVDPAPTSGGRRQTPGEIRIQSGQ